MLLGGIEREALDWLVLDAASRSGLELPGCDLRICFPVEAQVDSSGALA